MTLAAQPTVALFARYPTPGAAKTRLIPALGADGAARVHRMLVERTLAKVAEAGLPVRVHATGADKEQFAAWLGPHTPLAEQGEGDLGARLARVVPPAILLGADIPGLEARHLCEAATALAHSDVVIGPAHDGGYYLLGFTAPVPFLFDDMPWGSDAVFDETMRRLGERGLAVTELESLEDLDRPSDLANWPELLA